MAPRPKLPTEKQIVLIVGLGDVAMVNLYRAEIRSRYHLSTISKIGLGTVKSSDAKQASAVLEFGDFTEEKLQRLEQFCQKHGISNAASIDISFNTRLARYADKLMHVRYHVFSHSILKTVDILAPIFSDVIAKDAGGAFLQEREEGLRRLSDRIELAAQAIEDLRLNSTAGVLDELRAIKAELLETSGSAPRTLREVDLRRDTKDVLSVLAGIFDAIENSRLAAIIISGAVSAIVAKSGWPAAWCQTVCLAAWYGKEPFMAAVNKLPSLNAPSRRQK